MMPVQRRCTARGCRRTAPPGVRTCPGCGSRRFAYIARYVDPQGRERSESFARSADAEAFAHAQETGKATGAWIDPAKGRVRLSAFRATWRSKAEARLAATTLDKFDRAWRLDVEPALGVARLVDITKADVLDMVRAAESRSSAWQAAEALKLVRLLLNAAVDAEMIVRNVAARISLPQAPARPVLVHTPEELHAALDALGGIHESYVVPVMLDAYSGLRWSELVALKDDDVDPKAGRVRVDERLTEVGGSGGEWDWGAAKTVASADVIDLPRIVMKPLSEHLLRYPPLRGSNDRRLEGLLFHEDGHPLRRKVVSRAWRAACEAARVPVIRLEWLRHTGASLAYAATGDLKAVSRRLRHRDTRMVDRVYVQAYDEAGRETADAIDELATRRLGRTEP
jgi:integrase